MQEAQVLELLRSSDAILQGHFQLSSGLHSDTYIQCARVLQFPDRAERLGGALAKLFSEIGVDAVASPALGGILVGHEVARALGVRAVFAERDEAAAAGWRCGGDLRFEPANASWSSRTFGQPAARLLKRSRSSKSTAARWWPQARSSTAAPAVSSYPFPCAVSSRSRRGRIALKNVPSVAPGDRALNPAAGRAAERVLKKSRRSHSEGRLLWPTRVRRGGCFVSAADEAPADSSPAERDRNDGETFLASC